MGNISFQQIAKGFCRKSYEWVSEWMSEQGLMAPSTHYRSFRRRVFPVNHLHWYWQPNKNNQVTEHTDNIKIAQHKESLVNSTTHTLKRNLGWETGQTEPGLVAFYDIRPGNRAGLFLQLQSLHGAGSPVPKSTATMETERIITCKLSISAHNFWNVL